MNIFKNHLFVSLAFILVASLFSCTTSQNKAENAPNRKVKIIFDTDMGPDFDDVGAITMLHAFADKGECEILATVSSNGNPRAAQVIEIFNRYFNRADIPIGVPENPVINFINKNNWNDSLVMRFQPELIGKTDYPSAAGIYRRVLAAQPDSSVTILTVGFTTNIASLLKTEGDEYSPLSGVELVKQKVRKLVAMAGKFPEGKEYNVFADASASVYTFANWPTPILFSGYEIGKQIMTGNKLSKEGPTDSPVAWAYRYNLATYFDALVENRSSYDQTAVLAAIRDPENYFYVCGGGKFIVQPDGHNYWDGGTDANHFFLVHKYPYQKISSILEELMMHEPNNYR